MSADTFNEIKARLENVVGSIQDIGYDLFENDFSDEEKEELLALIEKIDDNDLRWRL